MRQSRRNGWIAAVVAGGALSVAGAAGQAFADSDAQGRADGSPGLLSGNLAQLPVDVPVNVCGNTVSVVGLLNPAAGNDCRNGEDRVHASSTSGSHPGTGPGSGSHPGPGRSLTPGGATADGRGKDSPGLLSGNTVRLPVEIPVNVSGNSVNVVGIGNPSSGNTSVNRPAPLPVRPVTPERPAPPLTERPELPVAPGEPAPQGPGPSLAQTGAEGLGYALPTAAALLLGGAVLYRRHRPGAEG
ncbi:chaplin [Streptomyces sp. NPDC097619]|uniref:chaplin n=1 Tax=Streptomyces sp. NPDC097619 TaxID=3157228 RepID=UPI0033221AD7